MIDLVQASTPEQIDAVRGLMRAFVAWHRQRHSEDRALIERYFDAREFEQELAGLPGKYAPPKGRLLLARKAGQVAGCVALRDLGGGTCEMKRMFVPPALHGQGVGRALADRVISEAKTASFTKGCGSIPAPGRLRRSACMNARGSRESNLIIRCRTI